MEFYTPGPPNKFDSQFIDQRLKNGDMPHGFLWPYAFSASVAFTVVFDESGEVIRIEDRVTMADLLR